MQFHVTQQYGRGPEQTIGRYKDLAEARKFVEDKLLHDAHMRINTTYRIYEWDDVIDELNSASWQKQAAEKVSSETSRGGAGTRSTFSPTPLATAPRPAGMPPSSFKREDDNQGKK